ncbi:PREDICTED: uncharacterized protein LOC103340779 isoform X2 [Prunus mume]|uniref:Uncharacterized protein LOC103340779 isoform X2 n=1 Tax=Prunus mume TaxID=102107 RepID=A0ABM1LWL6_PRUMU|nr:PREDICTED: uncharacterized protein LOC103340779 isoform X2 [Prunus mume]
MGDRYTSQFSTAAAELTSGQGHDLTMASRQDDLLGKISEMEKSMDKLPEMEKILGQLFDLMKSITQELRLQGPSPAITTTPLPPSTVMEYRNPNHEAHDLYQSLPDDWEHASMTVNQGEARSICLLVSSYGDGIYTNAVYEVKFKHGGEVPVIRHVAKFREGYCPQVARVFNHSNLYYFGDDGGFIVDMETWSKYSSMPPIPAPNNSQETIVYAYDKVYYLARRSSLQPVTEPSFGRYDPNQKCLVHLGNHDFFYVQTGWCDSHLKVQYLSTTTFQIIVGEGGGHMIKIIHSTVHSVDIKGSEWFDLVLCFTPECEDYEHIEEESMASISQPRQEITAMKLETEAMLHEEANDDAIIGY